MRRLLLLSVAALAGCSTLNTGDKIASVQSAVSKAQAAGADQIPAAKTALDAAMQGLAAGKSLASQGRPEQALRSLDKAGSDADLARTLGTSEKTRAEAQSAKEQVAALKASLH